MDAGPAFHAAYVACRMVDRGPAAGQTGIVGESERFGLSPSWAYTAANVPILTIR